jgi:hypothetical protein
MKEFMRKILYVANAFITKPKWFTIFLLGRFQFVRSVYVVLSRLYCSLLKLSSNTLNNDSSSLFTNLDIEEIVKDLKSDGIFTNFSMPNSTLVELLDYVNSSYCFAGGITDLGFKLSEKDEVDQVYNQPFYTARYFNVSISCPTILKLANDQTVREIANQYIGGRAKYTGASLFWTFPVKGFSYDSGYQHFSQFHYDIDDYASLRFCFYLTDVTPESGPHVCIRGSHRKKPILQVLNIFSRIQSEQNLAKIYGRERFITLEGKSGFGFIEDTFCFHKGIIPKSQPRLFLQLHFATNRYACEEFHDYREPSKLKHFKKGIYSNTELKI